MFAVVALHAMQNFKAFHPSDEVISYSVLCALKFGTIGFFLISGFLLGERVDTVAPLPYLSKRLKTLMIPWGAWFGLYVVALAIRSVFFRGDVPASAESWFHAIIMEALTAMFESSFWFVPNLAFGMCLLLLFRRHLYSVTFGAFLFAVNLVYVANIYGHWFISTHTTALFGFICYLWLGSFAARNFTRFSGLLGRVRTWHLMTLCLMAWLASYGEMRLLFALHDVDPTNTLRISNQVFSMLVVLLLVKVKSRHFPHFIHVRQQTFGIYLMHWFYLRAAIQVMLALFASKFALDSYLSVPAAFLMCSILFAVTYGLSMRTSDWLAKQRVLRWTIGLKSEKVSRVGWVTAVPKH